MNDQLVKVSKLLSLVLRHKPEKIGLSLDGAGWAEVDDLIARARQHGVNLDRELLQRVVDDNDKQRFAFSEDGERIRASQGHSIEVELELPPVEPPEELYHGTATRFVAAIRQQGLERRQRQHVHLSATPETAVSVGSRHGKPVVLVVAAGTMQREGYQFFLSANGVWLTAEVPARFISGEEG